MLPAVLLVPPGVGTAPWSSQWLRFPVAPIHPGDRGCRRWLASPRHQAGPASFPYVAVCAPRISSAGASFRVLV
eukprot:9790453-Prorocentrum_lima.AAC.1